MKILRNLVPFEEFDYQVLLQALKDYRKPRDKISQLLADKEIIRIKKGLYVFGDAWRKQPISLEILANLIFGPSYISCEYALSYYGMIPERTYTITSMTTGKNKLFQTPLGAFYYKHLKSSVYPLGVQWLPIDASRHCLFATKEKALADTLAKTPHIDSFPEMQQHLLENLRIEKEALETIDMTHLLEIASAYHNRNVKLLFATLEKLI